MKHAANVIVPGWETIYPGSHELRPLALFQVESPLVPEGTLVLASLERKPLDQRPKSEGYTPEQYAALLTEVVALIVRQMKRSNEVRAMIGHRGQ